MSFAIIETGGKQYKITEGDVLHTEKILGVEEGSKVTFNKVLLVSDGDDVKIGTPYVEGVQIEAMLETDGKEKKIDVMRFRSKSRHHKKYGHRQPYNEFKIGQIGEGKASKKKAATKKTPASEETNAAHKKTQQKPEDIGSGEAENKAAKKKKPVATPKSRNTNKETDNTMEEKETRT